MRATRVALIIVALLALGYLIHVGVEFAAEYYREQGRTEMRDEVENAKAEATAAKIEAAEAKGAMDSAKEDAMLAKRDAAMAAQSAQHAHDKAEKAEVRERLFTRIVKRLLKG